ncbi:MAG: hypothetical protein R3F59_27300 [Myxococcota bacterium]
MVVGSGTLTVSVLDSRHEAVNSQGGAIYAAAGALASTDTTYKSNRGREGGAVALSVLARRELQRRRVRRTPPREGRRDLGRRSTWRSTACRSPTTSPGSTAGPSTSGAAAIDRDQQHLHGQQRLRRRRRQVLAQPPAVGASCSCSTAFADSGDLAGGAVAAGGAVSVDRATVFEVHGTRFFRNLVSGGPAQRGGAIYGNNGEVTATDNVFCGNDGRQAACSQSTAGADTWTNNVLRSTAPRCTRGDSSTRAAR